MKVNWYNASLALTCGVFFIIDAFVFEDIKEMIVWALAIVLNLFFIITTHQAEIYNEITKKNKEEEEDN